MLQTKMGMKQLDADSSSLIVNIGMTKMLSYVKFNATVFVTLLIFLAVYRFLIAYSYFGFVTSKNKIL